MRVISATESDEQTIKKWRENEQHQRPSENGKAISSMAKRGNIVQSKKKNETKAA